MSVAPSRGRVSLLRYEGLIFPSVSPRWCTGNRDSAVWLVESRAQCRCPVATDSSARAAPSPQSARCAPNRPWSSSSPDLTTLPAPPQIPDQSVLIPQTPAFGLDSFSKLHPDNVSTDLVFVFSRWRLLMNELTSSLKGHPVKAPIMKFRMYFQCYQWNTSRFLLITALDQQHCSWFQDLPFSLI